MKFGNVVKSAENGGITAEILEKVNKFTRKQLTEDEIYVFPVIMCDNEVDRDVEKFTVEALNQLATLFIGKTMICDHMPKNANQIARIFDTEVVHTPSTKTFDGEDLYQLKGMAYMLKTDSTAETIANIEAGIFKEVSVNCKVKSQICSICGEEYYGGTCQHFRGMEYSGKKCFVKLSNATDAYELSFVAIPAQPGAGVTKWYDGDDSVKKGTKATMNYEEVKKSLATMGIDLDGIATEKGKVPEMSVILGEVNKRFGEASKDVSLTVFTTEEAVKSAMGKETVTEADMLKALKSSTDFEAKAKLYDELKSKAVDSAIALGIKAKGDSFGEDRYRKVFENFTLDEVNEQASEWEVEAKKELHPGRSSEDEKTKSGNALLNIDDYKL